MPALNNVLKFVCDNKSNWNQNYSFSLSSKPRNLLYLHVVMLKSKPWTKFTLVWVPINDTAIVLENWQLTFNESRILRKWQDKKML